MQTNLQWEKADHWLPRNWGDGKQEVGLQRSIRKLWGVMGDGWAHYFDYGDGIYGYVCVCVHIKTYQIVPFKYVQLIARWLYFNKAVRKE